MRGVGRLVILAAAVGMMAGCRAHRPDVAGEAARLTGVADAIRFEGAAAGAGEEVVAGHLSAATALRRTLSHDPRIAAALARVRVAEADAGQARLLPNPILSLDIRFPTSPATNTSIETTLAADVLSLLQKPGQIRAADKRLRAAAADALTVVLDVMAEEQASYAAAASFEAQVAITASRREILQHLLDIGQKRLAAGEGTRLEVITLQAEAAQARLDEALLRDQMIAERLHLARLIGMAGGDDSWTLDAPAVPAGGPAPEAAWVATALRNRPEIQSRVWELRALGDDLDAAALAPLAGGDAGVHAEHDPVWRLGPAVSVPVPIFDFGQGQRARIRALRAAARADLAQQEDVVVQEVRTAYAGYVDAGAMLAVVDGELAPLQAQQRDLAQHAYDSGEIDLSGLLLIERDLRASLAARVDLLQKAAAARAQLFRAAGGAGPAASLILPDAGPATLPATSRPATGGAR